MDGVKRMKKRPRCHSFDELFKYAPEYDDSKIARSSFKLEGGSKDK